MALLERGRTLCGLCGKTIRTRDEVVSFPAFLPETHRLARFSDAAFHRACFERSSDRQSVERLYALHQEIWASRPRELRTVAEMDAWARDAFSNLDDTIALENLVRRVAATEGAVLIPKAWLRHELPSSGTHVEGERTLLEAVFVEWLAKARLLALRRVNDVAVDSGH